MTQRPRFRTEDLGYPRPQPSLCSQSSAASIRSSTTPRATTTPKLKYWKCCICLKPFHRWQERDRHEQTHLPYFLHCPVPHCEWRGNRAHLFKTHWQKDHRPYHQHHGPSPEGIKTYDPRTILNLLRTGAISRSDAEVQAMVMVQVQACELQKQNMWTDPWGRSGKQASRCR